MLVRITKAFFDPYTEVAAFMAGRDDMGALVNFVGYCRSSTDGKPVQELRIDHYEGFTQKEILRICEDIASRFRCPDLLVVHRVGTILPGEAIVLVGAVGTHRANAFDAVRVLMDYLKTDAPLWKKETGPGGARWIEPRMDDYARRAEAEKGLA